LAGSQLAQSRAHLTATVDRQRAAQVEDATPVADLSPLAGLAGLQKLHLSEG
jgi:hypothetical protein